MAIRKLVVYAVVVTMTVIILAAMYGEEKITNNQLNQRMGMLRNTVTSITLECSDTTTTISCELQGGMKGIVACHTIPTNSWWESFITSNSAVNTAVNTTTEFYSESGIEDHVNNATDYLFGLLPDGSDEHIEQTRKSWFGGGSDDKQEEGTDTASKVTMEEEEEDQPKVVTTCIDPQKATYGDECGACLGDDAIPKPCTSCPCTIGNGPQLGQDGYWLFRSSIMNLHNHTLCATKERSIALQLEKSSTMYSEYKCVEC